VNERPSAKIIDVVRKILSKTTENGCSQAEAAHAFAKAQELLLKHNLSMDDVRCQEGGAAEEKFVEEAAFETGRWTIEQNLAYHVVHTYFFVEGFFGARNGNQKVLYLFGTEANVATARHVFAALLAATERLWVMYKVLNRRPASEARLFRTGVIKGFTDKLKEQREALKMEQDIASGSEGGTALAIRRVEDMTVQKYKEAHPKHKAGRGHYADVTGDPSTLQAGYDAGKKLNLDRAVEGNKRKAIE
jgi:hypothetical protein